MRPVLVALLTVALAGCGSTTTTVTTRAPEHAGWSARARDNFINYCESASGGKGSVCECEASKIEAKAPSDAQLRELETNPAEKEHLVRLMIDASYACVGSP